MRLKKIMLSLAVFLAMAMAVQALPPELVKLELDASNTVGTDLSTWANKGSLGGSFNAVGSPSKVTNVVDVKGVSKKALTFGGMNGYRSTVTMPDDFFMTNAPWTVSYNVLNPSISNPVTTYFSAAGAFNYSGTGQNLEPVFGLTDYMVNGYDINEVIFNYHNDPSWGAVNHGYAYYANILGYNIMCSGMGFDRGVPELGAWHNITVTYSGASRYERIYVDGILNAAEKRPNTKPIDPETSVMWIATPDAIRQDVVFTGSLASVKVWGAAATENEVRTAAVSGATVPFAGTRTDDLVNPSFELGLGWSTGVITSNGWPTNTPPALVTGDRVIIPGWAVVANFNEKNPPTESGTSDATFADNSPLRAGIGVYGANKLLSTNGGPWNNGAAPDGTRVLGIAGTATTGQAVSQFIRVSSGRQYHVGMYVNASMGGQAMLTVKYALNGLTAQNLTPWRDGGNILTGYTSTFTNPMTVNPVASFGVWSTPFLKWEGTFTPNADGFAEIIIEQSLPGVQNVLLVDSVDVSDIDATNPVNLPTFVDFGQTAKGKVVTKTITVRHTDGGEGAGGRALTISAATVVPNTFTCVPALPVGGTMATAASTLLTVQKFSQGNLVLSFTGGSAPGRYTGKIRLAWNDTRWSGTQDVTVTCLVPAAPTVLNSGFETPVVDPSVAVGAPGSWYQAKGDNMEIPFWVTDGGARGAQGIGVTNRAYNHIINNGTFPPSGNPAGFVGRTDVCREGRQALWMTQQPGVTANTRTITQMIGGWDVTKKYTISIWVDARNNGTGMNTAQVAVKLNNVALTPVLGTPSGGINGQTGLTVFNALATPVNNNANWYNLRYRVGPNNFAGLPVDPVLPLEISLPMSAALPPLENTLFVDDVQVMEELGPASLSVPIWSGDPTAFVSTRGVKATSVTLTLQNNGGTSVVLTGIDIVGPDRASFYRHSPAPNTQTVGAFGHYAQQVIGFKPVKAGVLTAAVRYTITGGATYDVPLKGVSYDYPEVINPSFEQPQVYWDNTLANPGDRIPGGIPGWIMWNPATAGAVAADGIGIGISSIARGPVFGNPPQNVDNGKIVDGNQAAWISASRALRQTVYGFFPGQNYTAKAIVNCRAATSWGILSSDAKTVWQLRYAPGVNVANNALIPGTQDSIWVDLEPQNEMTALEADGSFTVPYTTKTYEFSTPANFTAGAFTFEFNVPAQGAWTGDGGWLLLDAFYVDGPSPNAIKSWTMFE